MKISLTDQFLWDLYNFFEPITDNLDIILRPRTTYKLSYRIWNEEPVFKKYRHVKNTRRFRDLIYYLKKNNYIKSKNLQGKQAIMITKKGIENVLETSLKINKSFSKRKDGKWIMIIFDIPESHKRARRLLRNILRSLGYKLFQHSVWITSYDVSDKTEGLLQYHSLDQYVRIFLIEKI